MSVKTQKSTDYQPPKETEAVTPNSTEQFAQMLIDAITERLNHLAVEQKPTNGQSSAEEPKPNSIETDLNQPFQRLKEYYEGKQLQDVIKKFIAKL